MYMLRDVGVTELPLEPGGLSLFIGRLKSPTAQTLEAARSAWKVLLPAPPQPSVSPTPVVTAIHRKYRGADSVLLLFPSRPSPSLTSPSIN